MSEPSPTESLQTLRTDILESIARGEAMSATLDRLCRGVEALLPGVACLVAVQDEDGQARSFGSLGLLDGDAADPDETPLVEPAANPVLGGDGLIIGSLALHGRAARRPHPAEPGIVAACLELCAIAIAHERTQARNHRLAYYDTLTGLPNRVHFADVIARMTTGPLADLGLLLIDVDHLKTVNDTLGHAIGDALIATVGARLDAAVTDGMPFRIGGDEFAVLLPGCGQAPDLRAVAGAIIAAMEAPHSAGGHTIVPGVTIGGALSGEDGDRIETLRQNADLALYHAKETRRGGYVRFRSGMRTRMTQRAQTVRDVDAALGEGRIMPYYQPVLRLDTAEIVGLEALARMRLDDGRVVAAGAFQEALADPKLGHRITSQMLEAIAADIALWRAAEIDFQHVGLNVTTADFQKGDLVARIARACERAEIPVSHIVVEVTEQVFMGGRRDGVARTLEALRERGMPVALDDFGTGFASLTHLLDFPVDIIKIDRSFVSRIGTAPRSLAIVDALIGIAARLDIKVIAEGIEEVAQAERLVAMGCRLGQGFLYGRPLPAAIARQMIERFGQRRAPPPPAVSAA